MIINTEQFVMPSDPTTIKQIKDACIEIDASMTRAAGEKDLQKEAIASLHEATAIPKKHLNKIARLYHRANKDAVVAENEATVDLYERIFPDTTQDTQDTDD